VRRRWWWLAAGAAACLLLYVVWPRGTCRSAETQYGLELPVCPEGILRQKLSLSGEGLHRGGPGTVQVRAYALYTIGEADSASEAPIPSFEVKLSLLDGAGGKERPLEVEHERSRPSWAVGGGLATARLALPEGLHDGDYLLRARVVDRVGTATVDLPLPLYAPARIHVLTDRPLYEPGHRVQFRALALRARDLTPIDNRPGLFQVKDPSGAVLLEEKASVGEWGVVAGSFLLDREAATGEWSVAWRSGSDEGSARFTVEPFTLPRFRVSAQADRAFYGIGDKPRLTGAVLYSSGAPVQGAGVELAWSVDGAWPPPTRWLEKELPRHAVTDASGQFSATLPAVPADLQGRATLRAAVSVTDAAGDRVTGEASVLLSQDAIQVSAITPFEGGLVGGYSNRLYLRVTTADGRSLPGTRIKVRRAWLDEPDTRGAELDADSVARIQIDPGPPVNVVIPAVPVRAAPAKEKKVSYSEAKDLITDENASLDDQVELDRWLALLEPCGKWIDEGEDTTARLALQVSESGAILSGLARTELERCALARVKGRRLPAGRARLFALDLEFSEPALPSLQTTFASATSDDPPESLTKLVETGARDARDCLPRGVSGELPWVLSYQLAAKSRKPVLTWLKTGATPEVKIPDSAAACILSRLRARTLETPAEAPAMGIVRCELQAASSEEEAEAPSPTIMKGYELLVSAEAGGKPIGQTRLRLGPGELPRLTVRAEPVVAAPGSTIDVELIRGPKFSGALPSTVEVEHQGNTKSLNLPKDARRVRYTLPPGESGWFAFSTQGSQALVYAKSKGQLAVTVAADQPRYAPGARARLRIKTLDGDRGTKAAVGLVGVDESLAQLVPLPGPDALRAVRPEVPMKEKAFGILDGQALALGRVRGRYAAEATVLRVASIPRPASLDSWVTASAETRFDPNSEITDRFYSVLAELHRAVRTWEKAAPPSELMTPARMVDLWSRALEACAARGQAVVDAFGRRLRLHRLPPDLLALTDPRQVVVVGTRLPEDVEDWAQWVSRRKP
jgi:hypothetical protein